MLLLSRHSDLHPSDFYSLFACISQSLLSVRLSLKGTMQSDLSLNYFHQLSLPTHSFLAPKLVATLTVDTAHFATQPVLHRCMKSLHQNESLDPKPHFVNIMVRARTKVVVAPELRGFAAVAETKV